MLVWVGFRPFYVSCSRLAICLHLLRVRGHLGTCCVMADRYLHVRVYDDIGSREDKNDNYFEDVRTVLSWPVKALKSRKKVSITNDMHLRNALVCYFGCLFPQNILYVEIYQLVSSCTVYT